MMIIQCHNNNRCRSSITDSFAIGLIDSELKTLHWPESGHDRCDLPKESNILVKIYLHQYILVAQQHTILSR